MLRLDSIVLWCASVRVLICGMAEQAAGPCSLQSDLETSSDIEAEYEIVEHEQAHAIAVAKTSRKISLLEEQEEESRWSQTGPQGNLSEPFLDTFAGMINRVNLESILKEQAHM